jgi:hypothetical protein
MAEKKTPASLASSRRRLTTKFEIKSWDEKPYRELPDGRAFKRADVVLSGGADGALDATWESVLYYEADGTSSFSGLMYVTGTLDGREGEFVMQGTGTYDGTEARIKSKIIASSGGLTGITGTSEHVSTHADYPHWPMKLTYELE